MTTLYRLWADGFDDKCMRCALAKSRRRVVPGEGPLPARICLVGEAPGAREDLEGRPFVGASGRALRALLEEVGVSRVWITNTYKCRPYQNRIAYARGSPCPDLWLKAELRYLRPRVIVALGRTAASWFLPGLTRLAEAMNQAHTWERSLLLVTYHPAARTARAIPHIRDTLERARAAVIEG